MGPIGQTLIDGQHIISSQSGGHEDYEDGTASTGAVCSLLRAVKSTLDTANISHTARTAAFVVIAARQWRQLIYFTADACR